MKAILKIDNREIEVEVSEETIARLTEKKSPFARVSDKIYYSIFTDGGLVISKDRGNMSDGRLYQAANYCTDRDLIQQQAYRETLNRLLWRWQYEHDEPVDWRNSLCKWVIGCDYDHNNELEVDYVSANFKDLNVFFTTIEKAYQAIEEVVKPFMEEHPDFVW